MYEDNKFGGYGAEIAAIVGEEAFDYLDGPVTRVAGPDVPGVPYNHVLEDWFMVDPDKILEGMEGLREAGLDLDGLTQQLEDEGVAKFSKAFEQLMTALKEKRATSSQELVKP